MKLFRSLWVIAPLVAMQCSPASAESLNCTGGIAAEGDSRISVLYKCGKPLLQDSFCAPVYFKGSPHPLPGAIAHAIGGCQKVEEWLYDRGPGNLMATVRFRAGVIQSITYGHSPQ